MDPQLNNAILRCRNLPTPAGIAMRIIGLAQDPDTDIGSAADIIALDPALAGRIMRLANSPLYASRRRIESLNQAMTMLGLHATLQLALGFTLVSAPQGDDTHSKAHAFLCRRSIISALSARLLGEITQLRQPDELMLAGLLQDIGALALLQLEPERYAPALLECPDGQALIATEIALFGCDHTQVGIQLASQWNLPPTLGAAIACSETPALAQNDFQRCIALSGKIADIWLCQDPTLPHQRACESFQQHLQLPQAEFNGLLSRVEALLPEMASLFDTRIDTPEAVHDLLEQAAELAMLRQLKEQSESQALREQALLLQKQALELAEQARRDPLTGVTNRRHMETALDEAFKQARITGHPLSLAFIDLDDFKKINDRHGHIIGDHVLKGFARRLAEQLRTTDTIARFGGEEFVLLFPATTETTATAIVQRVLELITGTPVAEADGIPLTVTFSAGIATHGEREQFSNAEDLLAAADRALYHSKNQGRNRVETHSRTRSLLAG